MKLLSANIPSVDKEHFNFLACTFNRLNIQSYHLQESDITNNVRDSADQSIENTILKAKEGDVGSFERLVRHYQSYVFALAVRLLCDEDEAKDIVQESFVRVWKSFDRYDPDQRFTTWLYKIAANLCLDRLRASKRKSMLVVQFVSCWRNSTMYRGREI